MNKQIVMRIVGLISIPCCYVMAVMAGINLERLNASTDPVGTREYLLYVGLPITGVVFLAIGRVVVWATLFTAASKPDATPTTVTTVRLSLAALGAEAGKLTADGKTKEARALLDAADVVRGEVK